ncbi:MAG: class II aldolase/adducin family protein [Hyphomicrobiales bacterium]
MNQIQSEPNSTEYSALKSVSAEIGVDPMLIQAAGGNTSIKDGNVMWIKASGTLLADALEKDIFVPVDLAEMRKAVAAGEARADQPGEFLIPGFSTLRPSIETSLHAVFEQNVVIHAHSVNTLAHAIRSDAETLLETRLNGLKWASVPYAKPGANLARAVTDMLGNGTDVIILRNHGVIVAADTVGAAHVLLRDVHDRLALDEDQKLTPNLELLQSLADGGSYQLPDYEPLHQLALKSARCSQASAGSLYPDHVIFCGIGVAVMEEGETPQQVSERLEAMGMPAPVFMLIPGTGVLARSDASSGAVALMRCLADVLMRVPTDVQLDYLSHEQNLELLNWDAEKYRQALNAS